MNKFIKISTKIKEAIKNNITMKMFFVTTIVFITFLTITLISQRMLFEKIYDDKKETDIKNNVIKFKDTLNSAKDESEIIESIKLFESNYNTSIGVVNPQSNVIITFKTNSELIDSKNTEIFNYIIKTIRSDSNLLAKILSSQQVTISFTAQGGDTKYLASAIMDQNNIIIGFTSLQHVKEAMGVIGIFYKYFYIGAIVVIVVLSLMYSKIITKPLRVINKVAVKMSNLDFGEKCEVSSKDEIGNLGDTLNFLGSNLESSLTSLKEINKNLQSDIDKERQIENMRKEFIADVSHELKTPITLIKGYAEGIKDGIFLENNIDLSLDVIIEESNKMGNLVKDMLQLSSLESGKMILDEELFYIDNLIKNVVKKLHYSIDNKNINVKMKLEHSKVYGDIFKIEQVITNFLTNAIRHANIGGSIFVEIYSNYSGIQVSFENTGEFIKDEELDKLWVKFYKVDRSRNRKDGGTGLGLSIVKNIIDLHMGECGAENTAIGVKFYFTLPVKNHIV
ncbi:HAMP domain-containing sensor histidine kinase [Clostridium sp.]|uniref:HAMP domain-containing sensor histidine kinase n=1 Tax=Clostridium sp. TaxID=1506 RepID=UPI0032176135